MDTAPVGTTDWAGETTVTGSGLAAPPIGTTGVPPAGGFDQDWNVTPSTHTKDWADDDWGGAEPQTGVVSFSVCYYIYSIFYCLLFFFPGNF